jgi:hypothetical protein
MHGSLPKRVAEAREIERRILQGTATLCSTSVFGRVCKAIWPSKTAEELAAAAHCSVRAAAYQISGEHNPSAASILAVMEACVLNSK